MKFNRLFFPLMIVAIVCCGTISIAQQDRGNPEITPIVRAASEILKYDEQSQPIVPEDEVVQSGDYAIVGWVNGPLGGTMLLKRTGETWTKVASDGGPIGLHHDVLMELGVPEPVAIDLSQKFKAISD